MVRLLAEWYDAKSKVNLGGFQSQLQASYMSSHIEELWYNKTVCLWMTIYIYIYILVESPWCNILNYNMEVSSNSNYAITFTFELLPLIRIGIP